MNASGDSLLSLVFPRPRLARGVQAQTGHLSTDHTGLAPGAVRSRGWICRLRCLLHEEGIFLRGDSITSGIAERGAIGSGHLLGARGLGTTTLLFHCHLNIGILLLLVVLFLLAVLLLLAGLLLLHPAVFNDALVPHNCPL